MSIPSTRFSRRRDLDVARESIVVSLIFFHTARIFDDLGFYVKNEPQEPAVTFILILAAFWGMPLMFSIAGFAIWHSLEKRTLKFSFISLTALAITLLLYETLVRLTRLTRFLLGMKSETVP